MEKHNDFVMTMLSCERNAVLTVSFLFKQPLWSMTEWPKRKAMSCVLRVLSALNIDCILWYLVEEMTVRWEMN